MNDLIVYGSPHQAGEFVIRIVPSQKQSQKEALDRCATDAAALADFFDRTIMSGTYEALPATMICQLSSRLIPSRARIEVRRLLAMTVHNLAKAGYKFTREELADIVEE